jgi:hypothetical protein
MVVSACGVLRTFTTLISSEQSCEHAERVRASLCHSAPKKLQPRQELNSLDLCHTTYAPPPHQVAPSLSLFSLYVGIDGNTKDLQIPARNLWLVCRTTSASLNSLNLYLLSLQFADWNHDKMVAENATSTRELTMTICNEETPPSSEQKLLPFLPMTFIGSASGLTHSSLSLS